MTTLAIQKMSLQEKLQVMEALWEDLSRDPDTFESPSWHRDALKQTEKRMAAGKEKVVDWSSARKALRNRFR